jgi:hypothetical protein
MAITLDSSESANVVVLEGTVDISSAAGLKTALRQVASEKHSAAGHNG